MLDLGLMDRSAVQYQMTGDFQGDREARQHINPTCRPNLSAMKRRGSHDKTSPIRSQTSWMDEAIIRASRGKSQLLVSPCRSTMLQLYLHWCIEQTAFQRIIVSPIECARCAVVLFLTRVLQLQCLIKFLKLTGYVVISVNFKYTL